MSISLNALQQQRYDTAANWTAANPTLAAGELGIESDTKYFKVGDGSTAWVSLAYATPTQFSGYPFSTVDIADDAITGDKLSNDITVANDLTVSGNLTVNGTTTTIESTTVAVDDKNLELGSVATPTDATADGGGITLKGATDHTIIWTNSTDSWDFSEHVNIASAKEFRIDGTKVLDATSLGSGVVSSSLTSVGTITSGVWNGSQLATAYIADGAITSAKLASDVQVGVGDELGIGVDPPETVLHVSSDATPTIRITNETGDNDLDISVEDTTGDAELMVGLGSAIILGANNIEAVRVEGGDLDVSGDIIVDGTVDGRDIATDGTKLDGIETGATADQTKADIDALNINADQLDGEHGTYYRNASNLNAGTIPSARISDIGDSQARIVTLDNLEKSNLTADGQLSFDSSQGLLLYRTQQGVSGTAVTVLDGANVQAGDHISISNLGSGDTSTGRITFSVDDGAGSGLNADQVDGLHASSFIRADANDTATGNVTFNGNVNIRSALDFADGDVLRMGNSDDWTASFNSNGWLYINQKGAGIIFQDGGANAMRLEDNRIFRPETDGTGSIGTNTVRWSDGYFDDLAVTSTLNVRGAIDLADNDILRFGTGDDAEFFCNGSHMYLDLNGGIGNFYIRDGSTTRYTFNDNGNFTATGTINGTFNTTNVRTAIAAGTAGQVGTYALLVLFSNSSNRAPNYTVGSSNLYYSNSGANAGTNKPSGSWRLMGRIASASGDQQEDESSVWLRYA